MKSKNRLTKDNVIAVIGVAPALILLTYQIVAEKFIFPYYSWGYYGYLLIGVASLATGVTILTRCADVLKLWCIPGILIGVLSITAYVIESMLKGFQF